MARISIWVENELLRRLKVFAEKEHGDHGPSELTKVVEAALRWWLDERLPKVVFDIKRKALSGTDSLWKRFWGMILSEEGKNDQQTDRR